MTEEDTRSDYEEQGGEHLQHSSVIEHNAEERSLVTLNLNFWL